jgi:hypothetical protein
MLEQTLDGAGDFVRVATCATPTEAHLLKGVLESSGLTPHVADANIVQANTWMTQAVGGVRVLVPAEQVEAACKTIAEFNAGAYQLEGEDAVAVDSVGEQASPVFSPDRAALLSFVLTPAFGAAVQLANASILDRNARQIGAWVWLVLMAAASAAGVFVMFRLAPGPLMIFRTSFVLSFITVVWYFLAGQQQSKQVIAAYGRKYRQRSLAMPALAAAALELLLGWGLTEFV